MNNIARVFLRDVKRLIKAPAAWIVAIALIVLPSLYTWFNVAAFWNPYDATGNLTVCVVNEDAGTDVEAIGHLDVGSKLVEELRSNTQLGWDFVDAETAREKVKSGQAYAAFIIPADFSQNVASILTGEFVQPRIDYYVNEKLGPVNPKITDTGANSLDTKINDAFFSTVSRKITEVLNGFVADSQTLIELGKNNAAAKIANAAENLSAGRRTLGDVASDTTGVRSKTADAKTALQDAKAHVGNLEADLKSVADLASKGSNDLLQFSSAINTALDKSAADSAKAYAQATAALAKSKTAIESARSTAEDVRAKADQALKAKDETEAAIRERIDALENEKKTIEGALTNKEAELAEAKQKAKEAADKLAEAAKGTEAYERLEKAKEEADAVVTRITGEITEHRKKAEEVAAALANAEEQLEALKTKAVTEIDEAKMKADEAVAEAESKSKALEASLVESLGNAQSFRDKLSSNVTPAMNTAFSDITQTAMDLQLAISNSKHLIDEAESALDQLDSTLSVSTDALASTDKVLADVEDDLKLIRTDLTALSSSNTLAQLFGEHGINPENVADFMQSPTQIKAVELYSVNAYGSAMAPLFMNLTLWIGVFMLMVIVRLEVDDEGIERLTITQRFFGRGIFLAIMAALQACVCCTGCIAMGVQTANTALFYLTAVMASLTYLAVQYTLSSTLQHVGKAICIILVFVQIPGATGLYPIEMTPDFFQFVYPLFPFTYGINAIRETVGGLYGDIWSHNMAMLGAFLVTFIAIGALVRPYLTNLNRLFAREIEESDIVNGESVQLPARRYRMSQIISVFADREEYRAALDTRISRFMTLYPQLKQGALFAGIGLPVIATILLSTFGFDKVIILTTWLVWLVIVVGFLIFLEYTRDSLTHLVSLEAMSADELRTVYAQREHYTRVQPVGPFSQSRMKRETTDDSDADKGAPATDHEDGGDEDA